MAYLKQFARNRRGKENTKVLTARLPESLYDDFQTYCDSLGMSLSEAIYLLVEKEINSIQTETKSLPEVAEKNDDETEMNTGEYKTNTITAETNTISRNDTVKANSNSAEKNTSKSKTNTGRFTVQPFVVDGKAPCPICDSWFNPSNFARHAKKHQTTTEAIFTEYENKIKIAEMIESKKAELEAKQEN